MKPKLFVGSSAEALNIAYAIQENLEHDAMVTVWKQGVFSLSRSTLEDLMKALSQFDYAVFVFSPDDISIIRSSKEHTV